MDWEKITLLAVWFLVYGAWAFGVVFIQSREAIKRIDNPWKCRFFGIIAFLIFPAILFDAGSIEKVSSPQFLYWLAWMLFFSGFGLYYWARASLGPSWSSEAQVSERTKVVADGPYRLMRHPIYFSKILMAFCSAGILANWLVFLLACLLVAAAIYQARIEENLLTSYFSQYRRYREEVGMFGINLASLARARTHRIVKAKSHP